MKMWKIWSNTPIEEFIENTPSNEHVILMCPEECEIYQQFNYNLLKKFKKVDIVFGGYNNSSFYNDLSKKYNLHLWENYFLYYSVFTNQEKFGNQSNDIKYLFTCMNYKPKHHRCKFIDSLEKYNLLNDNCYTWHYPSVDFEFYYWTPELKTLDGEFQGQQHKFPREMYHSLFNLITESVLHLPFVTEKTYNSILNKKPFIIYGYPGIHSYLKTLGYKLPEEIIDYRFDNEYNNYSRCELIMQQLKKLSTQNFNELQHYIQPIVEHNYKIALNHIKSQFGVPEIIKHDNYYNSRIQESKRICE